MSLKLMSLVLSVLGIVIISKAIIRKAFINIVIGSIHRYRSTKIDCLSFVMCPLLAELIIGFFFAAVVYSTNEENQRR
jgi:hypothetical protein